MDDILDIYANDDGSNDNISDGGNEVPADFNENEDNPPPEFDDNLGIGEVTAPAPTKKRVRNLNNLNVEKLRGPRGVHTLENYFTNVKYKGKGYEDRDLDAVMKKVEHWAHRLYPKYNFDDSLAAFERLGKKKEMHSYMTKYRMNLLEPDEVVDHVQDNDDALLEDELAEPIDEFDQLLNEQIAISKNLSRSTHNITGISGIEPMDDTNSIFDEQRSTYGSQSSSRNNRVVAEVVEEAPPAVISELSEEMRQKIALNKQKALERLQARKNMVTVE
jgi:TIMELESS-interacting protein